MTAEELKKSVQNLKYSNPLKFWHLKPPVLVRSKFNKNDIYHAELLDESIQPGSVFLKETGRWHSLLEFELAKQ